MNSMKIYLYALLALLVTACSTSTGRKNIECVPVNMEHLAYLYDEAVMEGDAKVGIVHIYSEYPGYDYAIEPNEGYTCVDDVARAVVLLASCDCREEVRNNGPVMDKMIDFILNMQSDNGYFHNFIWHDGTINRTYRTSQARPDWWSWRALWAMETYAEMGDAEASKIAGASQRLALRIYDDLLFPERETTEIEGMEVPRWLPWSSASDQAGVLILALGKYYQRTGDEKAAAVIRQMAEGILFMQAGDSINFPYGAFMSWNNLWHAYGNIQAYALLRAGTILRENNYVKKALCEIDNFYPWLMEQGYLSSFTLVRRNGETVIGEQQKFPQIAYGFRPMVFACLEAYRITGKDEYLARAREIGLWFAGKNAAGTRMFDPQTGRCFDAIDDENGINRNSGAESTIEALLSLQALEAEDVYINELY